MREFLSRHRVEFRERDILQDQAAVEDLTKLRILTTPVTVVDGQVVVGFDPEKLAALLGVR